MKKKILIVIVAVAMMIPLLAVGVCADYSAETGWDAPVGTFEPFKVSIPSGVSGEEDLAYSDIWVGLPGELNGISYDFKYVMHVDVSSVPTTTDSFILYTGFFVCNYEEPTWAWDGAFACDSMVINKNYDGDFNITIHAYGLDDDIPLEFNSVTDLSFYFFDYPLSVADYSGWELLSFEVYEVSKPHPFLALIELMFDNFSRIIGGLAAGVSGAFTVLIWENPEATEKSLSTLVKFIFTIAGLAIGMTVFYMVFRLIRFGRQR